MWYLNVQIVARGNDASFGASDFRHRAWSDRDRRRHLQKVFLVVVVFEEQSLSLSLSLSDWNEERRRCSKEGVLFFKKYNPKLLSAEKKRPSFLRNNKKGHYIDDGQKHNRTTPRAGEDDDFDDVIVDGESRLVRAVFFVLVGEE